MKRLTLSIIAFMCAFALATLSAQRRPDVSGTGRVDLEKTEAPQFGTAGVPPELRRRK